MNHEKRKAPRRRLEHRALIVRPDKSIMGTCMMFDISEAGAQLELASADDCPAKFDLIISKHGNVRRRCAVVWQSESRVGVKFVPKKHSSRSTSSKVENDH